MQPLHLIPLLSTHCYAAVDNILAALDARTASHIIDCVLLGTTAPKPPFSHSGSREELPTPSSPYAPATTHPNAAATGTGTPAVLDSSEIDIISGLGEAFQPAGMPPPTPSEADEGGVLDRRASHTQVGELPNAPPLLHGATVVLVTQSPR